MNVELAVALSLRELDLADNVALYMPGRLRVRVVGPPITEESTARASKGRTTLDLRRFGLSCFVIGKVVDWGIE